MSGTPSGSVLKRGNTSGAALGSRGKQQGASCGLSRAIVKIVHQETSPDLTNHEQESTNPDKLHYQFFESPGHSLSLQHHSITVADGARPPLHDEV